MYNIFVHVQKTHDHQNWTTGISRRKESLEISQAATGNFIA